eukprot:CAMPEP_0174716500 /NCGR_PEP_ID=MMETSP1094-20130205/24289_1 /TAXON_ID=156173 /ORGANISM="Chrysochromulina brevifilum, Strain UTEX LB 985" /LENGTH=176 /DNA_ID=CAMNT_0015916269 /DNA_START=79 /DNA_END=609 /DNA_ORIENTATION=-
MSLMRHSLFLYLLLAVSDSCCIHIQPGLLRTSQRTPKLRMATTDGKEKSGGGGFGDVRTNQQVATEERGRKALEELRAATMERGYDSSLQGLKDRAEDEEIEVPQEFKSTVTLGLAGFLILGGVVALLVGGPLWEAKSGVSEISQGEAGSAFGFVPNPPEHSPAEQPPTASWLGGE